jgi:2-C-methyl-D-erythritol 4-phosphate cytidylyltransferase
MGLGIVLTAGGSGARFGGPIPKQFLEIKPGLPLLRCALETFNAFPGVEAIALTLPSDRVADWEPLVADFPKLRVVAGGPERWMSVRNGVEALPDSVDNVLIHDAARPFTPWSVIRRCVAALHEGSARGTSVIAAVGVTDTVKEVDGSAVVKTLDRSRLIRVQTPQGFPRGVLREIYSRGVPSDPAPGFGVGVPPTDEAMLVEAAGLPVEWVEGSFLSRKITTPEDWEWAEWTLTRIEKGILHLED